MALCVLAAAWKKAVASGSGRKAEEDESVAPVFVDGLLGSWSNGTAADMEMVEASELQRQSKPGDRARRDGEGAVPTEEARLLSLFFVILWTGALDKVSLLRRALQKHAVLASSTASQKQRRRLCRRPHRGRTPGRAGRTPPSSSTTVSKEERRHLRQPARPRHRHLRRRGAPRRARNTPLSSSTSAMDAARRRPRGENATRRTPAWPAGMIFF